MPWQRGAASARQQRKAIAQAYGNLLNAKRSGACRGELDGQRYAVESPADRSDRRQILVARYEV
jgi:hypothetical protein